MSYPASTLTEWLQQLPISWLANNPVGFADMGAQGFVYDNQVELLEQATEARYAQMAPQDALEHIGGDRSQFWIQAFETDPHFRERLLKVWNLWDIAGTPAALLIPLYYAGMTDAVIVEQAGKWFSIGSPPDLDNPIACVIEGDLSPPSTSFPGPPPGEQRRTQGGRYKAGDTNPNPTPSVFPIGWWTFDARYYFTSRFSLLLPGGWPIHFAQIVFDGSSDTASAPWSFAFNPADIIGEVHGTIITSGGPVTITISFTSTTVTAFASAPFVGFVDVLGFILGMSPFFSPSASIVSFITKLIKLWKPAKATCVFIDFFILGKGYLWGWPPPGGLFGPAPFWGIPSLHWGDTPVSTWQQITIEV